MKTVMFSLTFVVALVLYGAGFFVPETQGIGDTVDGHVVLNDAEMSQLVGGPSNRYTRELPDWPEDWYKGNGLSPPKCRGLLKAACEKVKPVTVIYDLWICVDCGVHHDMDQYTWEENAERVVEYYCDIQHEVICFLRKNVQNTADICKTNLETKCGSYAPVNFGNYW